MEDMARVRMRAARARDAAARDISRYERGALYMSERKDMRSLLDIMRTLLPDTAKPLFSYYRLRRAVHVASAARFLCY
jgi:hypothetical protein